MPTLSFDASGIQFVWNSTSIKLAEECLRKYQYKMIEGWKPRGLSVHLKFGAHYATALEHYYKHRALGATSEEALRLVVMEALTDTWDRETGPWLSDHNLKTRENLIRTIIWYVDQFEDEAITVLHDSSGAPMVEHSVLLDVDDGLMFAAHIDRMVEYGGAPYVMDQKTTATTITAHWFNQWSPDVQMSMYTFLGKAAFNIPVKGVILDAAQIAVGFSRFERGFTFRTESQLNEWYDDSMYHIERARTATRNAEFPMNRTACSNYGGCEFRGVCSRSPDVRAQWLAADFERGAVFDPLERR
jgi:hypothetical protein